MAYATINKPSEYFNTKLYTGNGSTQSITGVGFQPDMVWTKIRNGAYDHNIFDVIRGVTKDIRPNTTNAEGTQSGGLTSFDSDGYSLGSWVPVNESSSTYVSWNWLANGAGVSNTDGSITSTVSANDTAGFSIVKYTGTGSAGNVGHGLSTAPKVLINKALSSQDWFVGHSSIGFTKFLKLNETNAESTNSGIWNNIAPTTDHFTINSANGNTNSTGVEYITYCFSEVKGFSKFGSYTGNGNADGTFVYTGFKPAFILIKSVSTTNWNMFDNKRSVYNVADETLWSNTADSEATVGTSYGIDILSNGFKPRTVSSQVNFNSTQMIYMAFAEQPLVGTNNIPATAR
jgi:hypothetical protein